MRFKLDRLRTHILQILADEERKDLEAKIPLEESGENTISLGMKIQYEYLPLTNKAFSRQITCKQHFALRKLPAILTQMRNAGYLLSTLEDGGPGMGMVTRWRLGPMADKLKEDGTLKP